MSIQERRHLKIQRLRRQVSWHAILTRFGVLVSIVYRLMCKDMPMIALKILNLHLHLHFTLSPLLKGRKTRKENTISEQFGRTICTAVSILTLIYSLISLKALKYKLIWMILMASVVHSLWPSYSSKWNHQYQICSKWLFLLACIPGKDITTHKASIFSYPQLQNTSPALAVRMASRF